MPSKSFQASEFEGLNGWSEVLGTYITYITYIHAMNSKSEKLVKRIAMVSTITASYFLLTADYGPQPNVLDPVTPSILNSFLQFIILFKFLCWVFILLYLCFSLILIFWHCLSLLVSHIECYISNLHHVYQ